MICTVVSLHEMYDYFHSYILIGIFFIVIYINGFMILP